MRASLKIALYLAGVAGFAVLAKADPMGAYLMPAVSFTKGMESSESSLRTGGRFEFGRFDKNIALDLRFGQGGGYKDLGGSFKGFGHWNLGDREQMGLDFGGGLVLLYSKGLDSAVLRQSFTEFGLSGFVRFTYDFGLGFGVMADLGLEMILQRRLRATTAAEASSDSTMRPRPYLAIGVPIDF